MDIITQIRHKLRENSKRIFQVLGVYGAYLLFKFLRYLRWRSNVNKMIPGPNSDWESMKELYKADLGDFWGFNATLLTNLHNEHGKVVKLWLGGQPYISFVDSDDIAVVNRKAIGRPALTQNLLPHLGKKNLLFAPTGHDNGALVKSLRLMYGSMVQGDQPLNDIHNLASQIIEKRTEHWGKGTPINVFEELKWVMYDIMGTALFGGSWSSHSNGKVIFETHRYLIEKSATLGLSAMGSPTFANLLKLPSDYMKYQGAIKTFHTIIWSMVEQRRQEIKENPAKWKDDRSVLTLIVTEKDEDGKPFFDKILAISSCAGFLNGAYDTTHITTTWLLYNLAKHPEAQQKLIAEIDAAFGKPMPGKAPILPTMDQLRPLERLHASIQESMRLRVTVPLGMRGNYREDLEIGGVTVPKGATILPFTSGSHNNPKFAPPYYGDDVDKFRPERFMGSSPEAIKARRAFHGFGGGNRMCVGFKFAEAELKALFVTWLQRYTIELADPNMPSPGMVYESGCNTPKEKFLLIFKPRK